MQPFQPDRVYFEPAALNYPLGQSLHRLFQRLGVPIHMTTSHNRVTGIPGETEGEKYRAAKRTLVVGLTLHTAKVPQALPMVAVGFLSG